MTLDELLEGGMLLESGNVLRVHYLGELALPTGQLVARDPLAGADAPPFLVELVPGRYPVSLRVIHTPNPPPSRLYFDIAALVIRFRDGTCARWDIALTDHDPPRNELRAGGYPGFAVDSATAAFLDASFQLRLETDEVSKHLRDAKQPPGGSLLAFDGDVSIAVCSSGAGDGVYPAFIGYDAEARPVALVLDFHMLEIDRPALLTGEELDARVAIVAADLEHTNDASTVRAAMREAVALGERARGLVPRLEDLATLGAERSDSRAKELRDQAARALGELDGALGLRDSYAEVLRIGKPADRVELALTIAARLEWPDDQMPDLGAAASRIALTSPVASTVVAAVRCIDLFGVSAVAVWTALSSHPTSLVRTALLDACARNYRAERAASYNEDEREYRAQRVGVDVLDAVVASGMRDGVPDVRAAAANALGVAVAESPARRAALVPAIDDPDPRVVLAATQHLTFRKDLDVDLVARMRAALQRIADAGDRMYRVKATSALRRLETSSPR